MLAGIRYNLVRITDNERKFLCAGLKWSYLHANVGVRGYTCDEGIRGYTTSEGGVRCCSGLLACETLQNSGKFLSISQVLPSVYRMAGPKSIISFYVNFKIETQNSLFCPNKHPAGTQEFQTKMTISVISDLLKSMENIFQGFFPWNICKYLRHLSIHFKNYYILWRVCVVGFF